MRNVIYSIGIASFLACMTFTVATSLTNPFYGMSEAALAQATTTTSTTGTNGTTTYSVNPYRFKVKTPDKLIEATSIRKRTWNFGLSVSGGNKGIFSLGGKFGFVPEETTRTTSEVYENPTICFDGGRTECYKTQKGQTLFR